MERHANSLPVDMPRVQTESVRGSRLVLREQLEAMRDGLLAQGGEVFFNSFFAQLPYMVDFKAPVLKPPVDLIDVFEARVSQPHPDFCSPKTALCIDGDLHQGHHALQSAAFALEKGGNDEAVTAAFVHDFGKLINRRKHSYFAAEMVRPYVSENVWYMVRIHFDMHPIVAPGDKTWYNETSFEPAANRIDLDEEIEAMQKHPAWKDALLVREADNAARIPFFMPDVLPEVRKILARTFKLPKKGLGRDGSSSVDLWKLIIERAWMS